MIVLDTNVISELMRRRPAGAVIDWINRQPSETIWTTSVSVFEVLYGIELHPDAGRQRELRDAFELALNDVFQHRVFLFDTAAAAEAARIARRRKQSGLTSEIRDLQIAGIAVAGGAMLATRNTKDFEEAGVATVNPWDLQRH